MKTEDIILIGGVGLLAYMVYSMVNKANATNVPASTAVTFTDPLTTATPIMDFGASGDW